MIAAAKRALAGNAVKVDDVKQQALDAAQAAGDALTKLYQTVGFFAVFAGVLLLINIFRMLAEERQSELGMLRAMGMRRSSLIGSFVTEGWIYAVVAAILGAVLGIGVGKLVTAGAGRIIGGNDADFRLPLRFYLSATSLQTGMLLGLVIAMLTIIGTSIAISRLNIIAAIRDLEIEHRRTRDRARIVYATLAVAALALTAGSTVGAQPAGMMLGGGLAMLFLRRAIGRQPNRAVTTLLASIALVWGIAVPSIAVALGSDLPIEAFIVQGLLLVIASVVLVSEFQPEIGHAIARLASAQSRRASWACLPACTAPAHGIDTRAVLDRRVHPRVHLVDFEHVPRPDHHARHQDFRQLQRARRIIARESHLDRRAAPRCRSGLESPLSFPVSPTSRHQR